MCILCGKKTNNDNENDYKNYLCLFVIEKVATYYLISKQQ